MTERLPYEPPAIEKTYRFIRIAEGADPEELLRQAENVRAMGERFFDALQPSPSELAKMMAAIDLTVEHDGSVLRVPADSTPRTHLQKLRDFHGDAATTAKLLLRSPAKDPDMFDRHGRSPKEARAARRSWKRKRALP